MKRARLVKVLKQPGPFTVFASTDAAFEGLGAAPERCSRTARSCAPPSSTTLPPARLEAEDVVERRSVKTLNGKRVRIRVRDSKVF